MVLGYKLCGDNQALQRCYGIPQMERNAEAASHAASVASSRRAASSWLQGKVLAVAHTTFNTRIAEATKQLLVGLGVPFLYCWCILLSCKRILRKQDVTATLAREESAKEEAQELAANRAQALEEKQRALVAAAEVALIVSKECIFLRFCHLTNHLAFLLPPPPPSGLHVATIRSRV